MYKTSLILAGIFGASAVTLGAFGAHFLKAKLQPEQLQVFETAVKYQFYHALALLFIAAMAGRITGSAFMYAAWLFAAGILLFSGSLYLLSCRELLNMQSWKWLGPITPLGGLAFIAGWISLLLGAFKITN